jgi:hypothetical protein
MYSIQYLHFLPLVDVLDAFVASWRPPRRPFLLLFLINIARESEGGNTEAARASYGLEDA